jgi:hypothetical protein
MTPMILLTADEDALEPYCTQCGAKAGVFLARGGDWRHYARTQSDAPPSRSTPTTPRSSAGASPPTARDRSPVKKPLPG